MSDLSIDGDFFNDDFSLLDAGESRFSLLSSKEFETLQRLIDAHLQKLALVQEAKPSFNEPAERKALCNLIEAHCAPAAVKDACQSLLKRHDADNKAILPEERKAQFVATSQQIGKMLHLCTTASPQQIQIQFDAAIAAMLSRLQDYYQAQKVAGVQDPDLSRSIRLPVEIAKMLLSANGQINTALVPALKEALFAKGAPLEYEKIILNVMDQIEPSWQPLLDGVKKPEDPTSASNEVVRADLGLAKEQVLEDLHAKQAALAALLTQHCQGPVGDCFAMAYAIRLHNEFLQKALQEYGELITEGSLLRNVNGKPDRFFFKATIADDDLQKQIAIDATGKLEGSDCFLWQCPSFQSAFRQMGIDDAAQSAPAALQKLSSLQTTPDAILQAFAATPEELAKARYGFSAINNRTLRAFETTLAAMAESRKGDHVRDGVHQAVAKVLVPAWEHCKKQLSSAMAPLVSALNQGVAAELDAKIRFLYNASIPLQAPASDGSSTAGGFELYKRVPDAKKAGVQIVTPQQFQKLIQDVVDLTLSQHAPKNSREKSALESLAQAITQFVQGAGFMKAILIAYEPENAKNPDPVANYASLQRTPMTTQDGDNPWEVDAIDTGLVFTPNIQSVQPQNCYDLLKWVLDLASWKERTQHYLEEAHPDQLDPVTSPEHAFNLSIDDEEIVAFLKSGKTSDQWLSERLTYDAADWVVDDATHQAIVGHFVSLIAQSSQDAANQFQSWANDQLAGGSMALSAYAAGLLNILGNLISDITQAALLVDQVIYQNLPKEPMQQIEQRAVRFASTNWNDGVKEIFFCIYPNPRTKQPAFGTIDEDRTNLAPMNEAEWIDNQEWNADVAPPTLSGIFRELLENRA